MNINKNEVIGVGPSGRSLKTLNNKNNLATLYLKKKLTQYDREMNFSVSHLDRDKFDTMDFLQNVCQIDSDTHPAAVRYLGRDPRRKPYFYTIKRKGPPAPTTILQHEFEEHNCTFTPNFNDTRRAMLIPQTQIEEKRRPSSTRKDAPSTKENSATKKDSPRTSFPLLDKKQSIYLQIHTIINNPDELSDSDSSESDSEYASPRQNYHRKISMRRRTSTAWVQDQKFESTDLTGGLLSQYAFQNLKPIEKRRQSFSRWLKARETLKQRNRAELIDLQDNPRKDLEKNTNPQTMLHSESPLDSKAAIEFPVVKNAASSFKNVGEMVRTMVCLRPPVNDRITDLYGKINVLKLDEKDKLETPWQHKRHLTLVTKGVKSAIAESDDDDCAYNDRKR